MNSDLFRHRESNVYARQTFSGAREFHASSAPRAFRIALSRVNGGNGDRASPASCFAPAPAAFCSFIFNLLFSTSAFAPAPDRAARSRFSFSSWN
jgi:hypothetical protein